MDHHQLKTRRKTTGAFLASLLLGAAVCARAADVNTHILGATKQSLSTSTDAVKAGYYSGTWLSTVDPNLTGSNMKVGVSIFGKVGTYNGSAKTGQTAIYYAPGPNDMGDDGATQKGYPGTRFTNNGDFTVTDNATQLMWKQCSEGLSNDASCSGGAASYDWTGAFAQIANLNATNFSGHNDWRVPNVKELQSITDYGQQYPAIDSSFFPNTAIAEYWTSTTYAPNTALQWILSFWDGSVYSTNSSAYDPSYYLRAVRGP